MYRGVPSKILHVAGSNTIGLRAMAQAKAPKKMVKHYIGLEQPLPAVQVKENNAAFRKFLVELLVKRGKLKEKEAENYTDDVAMTRFELAMTHSSVFPSDPDKNYEMLEHLGDAIVNCITTWYLKNRFPDIVKWGNRGVQYLSKQKSLITSKPYLSEFAKLLGFIRFIRFRPLQYTFAKAAVEGGPGTVVTQTVTMDRSMEEDVFEAFFAALVEVIDEKEGLVGVGYSVAYSILSSFYDEREIPTSLNDLVDSKTQLKELFDKRARAGDRVEWKTDEKAKELWIRIHFQQSPGKETAPFDLELGPYSLAAKGEDSEYRSSKAVVEQQASRDALTHLQKNYGDQFIRFTRGE